MLLDNIDDPEKIKIASSGERPILRRSKYVNWATVISAGTKSLFVSSSGNLLAL